MIDESRDILTTFTDYSDETDVHFIDIPVSEGHPWIGLTVKDLNLPPGTLLVFLNHPGEKALYQTVIQCFGKEMFLYLVQPPMRVRTIFI